MQVTAGTATLLDLVDDGDGVIPRSCSDCHRGLTETWSGKPCRCEHCTRPDCDDGREACHHLPALCVVCESPLQFGHAFEAREPDGERFLVCDVLECLHEIRRGTQEPVPARAFAPWTDPVCSRCGFPTLLHGKHCEVA